MWYKTSIAKNYFCYESVDIMFVYCNYINVKLIIKLECQDTQEPYLIRKQCYSVYLETETSLRRIHI